MPAVPPLEHRHSPLAQRVFDQLLATRPTGMLARLALKILSGVRRWLVARGDPLVRFQVDGATLLAPLSHQLAFIRRDVPQYAGCLARIVLAVQRKHPGLACIDVGANIGDTVVLLRAHAQFPILCIEGSGEFFPLLEHNTAGLADVERELCLLADGRAFVGSLTTHHGTGQLVARPGAEVTVPTRTIQQVLESRPRFRQAKLLKVDTDGFDIAILQAALPWLAGARPVVFFEYDPHLFRAHGADGLALLRALAAIGYESALVFQNNGDFLLSAPLADDALWLDLDQFYSGRASEVYGDVCVFHREDRDLHDSVRAGERDFFRRFRAQGAGEHGLNVA
ncbi:MAG: FkbM family methyltransferase [Limisphaerales bacterium]